MTRSFAILLIVCLLFMGCVKQQRQDLAYYHPHKSFSAWQVDLDHCNHSVMVLKKSDRLQQESFQAGVENCMQAKGYVYGYRPYPRPATADGRALPEGSHYTLLDSTWHSTALAQKRAKYLEETGIWDTIVRSWDSDTGGVWQQVLVGAYDSLHEARDARRRLIQSHGLNDLKIVVR